MKDLLKDNAAVTLSLIAIIILTTMVLIVPNNQEQESYQPETMMPIAFYDSTTNTSRLINTYTEYEFHKYAQEELEQWMQTKQ